MRWLFNGLVHCCSLAEFVANMESVLKGGGSISNTGHDARHLTCDELGITGIVFMYSYRLLPSLNGPDRLWGLTSVLFNRYRCFYGVKGSRHKADYSLPPMLIWRLCGFTPLLPYTPFWCEKRNIYLQFLYGTGIGQSIYGLSCSVDYVECICSSFKTRELSILWLIVPTSFLSRDCRRQFYRAWSNWRLRLLERYRIWTILPTFNFFFILKSGATICRKSRKEQCS